MNEALLILDLLQQPLTWFFHLPPVIGYGVMGLLLAFTLAVGGFALSRMGFAPLWVLLLLVPFAGVIGLWILAFRRWPRERYVPQAKATGNQST